MNPKKKSDTKKILVRNTELPVPKTKLVFEEKKVSESKPKVTKSKSENFKANLQVPEKNSLLKLEKQIQKVEKSKVQKISEIAYCEKVTRKINFPADKAIYKDLIPLQVPARTPLILSSRDPLPQKDKEPQLSSFLTATQSKEYIYVPSVKTEVQSSYPVVNNLRLYKLIQMNNS